MRYRTIQGCGEGVGVAYQTSSGMICGSPLGRRINHYLGITYANN